ncbi:MAG: fimbrial protein [Candidatus Cryptobacteroides sp.]
MTKSIILSSAVCLALAAAVSCDRESNAPEMENPGEMTEITVSLCGEGYLLEGPQMTKATLNEAGEKAVNSVQVFVFREDGALDAYTKSNSSSGIKLSCTTGKRHVYAVVNAPDLNNVKSKSELEASRTLLTDNAAGGFVMAGSDVKDITAQSSIEISVKRFVSRVAVGSITANFTSDAYRNMNFTLKRIYMINVAGNTSYDATEAPDVWLNPLKWESGNADALLGTGDLNTLLASGTPYSPDQVFYVYPNSTGSDPSDDSFPRCTRLVLETLLGEKTYYYSVKIPSVGRNKKYNVNVTITRPGSEDPGKDISSSECTFSVKVEEWEDGGSQNITI